MPNSRPGDLLAGRYRLDDLMNESDRGRFWRGYDTVLARTVSVHAMLSDDPRCEALLDAARSSARLNDTHLLRVLDIDSRSGMTFVVNEWGSGTSLDHLLALRGPLEARSAAWLVGEVAAALTVCHEAGVAHGRLVPENILIDHAGSVRIIGLAVEAALHGLPTGRIDIDVIDLAGLLEAALTGRWAGASESAVPGVPHVQGGLLDRERDHVLTPRQLQPGVPSVLDDVCHEILNRPHGRHAGPHTAREVHAVLAAFVGDPTDLHDEAIELSATGQSTTRPIRHARVRSSEYEPTGPLGLSDLPTQKGTPIFGDDGEVGWFSRSDRAVSTPPPANPAPERPLFAPADDRRVPRTPVEPQAAGLVTPPSHTSVERLFSTSSGIEDDGPRRSILMRTVIGIGVVTLLVVAVLLAYSVTTSKPKPTPSAPASTAPPAARVIAGVTALDLDPSGDPPTENRDLTPRIVDGKTSTAWRSSTYRQQFGPQGLKEGVGIILDLHRRYTVTELNLVFANAGTTVEVYVTDNAPSSVAGLDRVASTSAGTDASIRLVTPTAGRYVTVWFTQLPAVGSEFRVELAEATVTGRPAA